MKVHKSAYAACSPSVRQLDAVIQGDGCCSCGDRVAVRDAGGLVGDFVSLSVVYIERFLDAISYYYFETD